MTDPSRVIRQLKAEAKQAVAEIKDSRQLETWRRRWLGRKGAVPVLLRGVKDVVSEERRQVGKEANMLRKELTMLYQELKEKFEPTDAFLGMGAPETRKVVGHIHPLTITSRRIQDIFSAMGFLVVDGPDVEEPRYNFDLLNIPPDHPSRAETDTFYLTFGLILRTHVSPMQLRGVWEHKLTPPFKILYYGRSFRAERTDATHETTFHQYEFLVVSERETIAAFKGTLETFYSTFFGKLASIRLRPSFFPFVEPGFEIDLGCVFCEGKGCRVCKQSGWIEMGGAGMVHPHVLQNMGFDPRRVQGFACGSGVDRLAMVYYGIKDIRLFLSGDIRFLEQFR